MYQISHQHDIAYPALSYAWGYGVRRRRLIVEFEDDESELLITDSLSDALRNIRVKGNWWIDAVCINQSDDQEKSWQVQMMRNIYEKATRVVAWIGPAADNSHVLIEQILDLPEKQTREVGKITANSSLAQLARYEHWSPPEDSLDLLAFWAMIKRPYWRRVWIQQELQNSRDNAVMIYCGRQSIFAALISFALQGLHKKRVQLGCQRLGPIRRESYTAVLSAFLTDPDVDQSFSRFNGHVHKLYPDIKPSFAMLLSIGYVNHSQLMASDPRDRIYALLGMISDSHRYDIKPDYSKSKAEVYIETSRALLKVQGMEVLVTTNFGSQIDLDPELPSWVADWSQPFLQPLRGKHDAKWANPAYPTLDYAASKGLKAQTPRLSDYDPEKKRLQLSGIEVDIVTEVGEPICQIPRSHMNDLISDQDPNFGLATSWLEEIETLSNHCGNAYGGHKGTIDAIWRVPITNAEKKERRFYKAPDSMIEAYHLCRSGHMRATVPAHEFYSERGLEKLKRTGRYWLSMIYRSCGRRFFVTEGGFLGVGPLATKKGDIVTIIPGLDCPIVLRPKRSTVFSGLGSRTCMESWMEKLANVRMSRCWRNSRSCRR
jgi:hypothetical protein